VACAEVAPADDPGDVCADLPFPVVVKPREGVASEDVFLCDDLADLRVRVAEIRSRRPGEALVAEEFLSGQLRTYDTLGDGDRLLHLSSWRTAVSDPPHFAEERLDWYPDLPAAAHGHLRAQLLALCVGLGACHTEFVVQGDRARIIEVNYRVAGDTVDFALAELLGVDLFARIIEVHRGVSIDDGDALGEPARLGLHARLDYVFADRAGVLIDAPQNGSRTLPGGVRIGARRLREPGVAAALTGTNRDYLAAVYAIGPDAGGVHAALQRYRSEHRWVIGEAAGERAEPAAPSQPGSVPEPAGLREPA
jgi:biotin carboxylase